MWKEGPRGITKEQLPSKVVDVVNNDEMAISEEKQANKGKRKHIASITKGVPLENV